MTSSRSLDDAALHLQTLFVLTDCSREVWWLITLFSVCVAGISAACLPSTVVCISLLLCVNVRVCMFALVLRTGTGITPGASVTIRHFLEDIYYPDVWVLTG